MTSFGVGTPAHTGGYVRGRLAIGETVTREERRKPVVTEDPEEQRPVTVGS